MPAQISLLAGFILEKRQKARGRLFWAKVADYLTG